MPVSFVQLLRLNTTITEEFIICFVDVYQQMIIHQAVCPSVSLPVMFALEESTADEAEDEVEDEAVLVTAPLGSSLLCCLLFASLLSVCDEALPVLWFCFLSSIIFVLMNNNF